MTSGRRLVLLVMATVVACVAPPAGAVSSGDARRGEIAEELERLAERVDEAASSEAGALAELELTRRAKAELEVAGIHLDRRITTAEADLAAGERARDAAVAAHSRAARRLEAAQARVSASKQVLREQAVARFMRFGAEASTIDVFLQVRDLRALHDAAAYVGAVASFQADVVRRHQSLQEDTAELERRTDDARADAEQRRREVVAHARELASARAAQAEALGKVAIEEEREEELVGAVRATRADYEARIAALEAESESITVLLRQRQAATAPTPVPDEPAADQDADAAGKAGGGGPARNSGEAAPAGRTALSYPLANPVVTSNYGYRIHPIYGTRRLHAGVDLRGTTGTAVLAAGDGTVVFAGPRGGYGTTVIVDHGGALATLYAHQSRLGVEAGDRVRRGQAVGAVGSTGLSTAPHLHFEVRVEGTPVDPLNYL